jgi:hypothetical protein
VFTIAPPRVDSVIHLRLDFVLRQLESTGIFGTLSKGLSVKSESLARYIRVLLASFKARDLVEFMDNLSGGNTRQALDFVTAFIGSGHVNAERILNIAAEQSDPYTIPVHEFMRAVIYGDFEHFDPSASPVANLFDIFDARRTRALPTCQ